MRTGLLRSFALVVALVATGCPNPNATVSAEVGPNEWQRVTSDGRNKNRTDRMAVSGGWLYRELYDDQDGHGRGGVALCFVADAAAVASRGEAPP